MVTKVLKSFGNWPDQHFFKSSLKRMMLDPVFRGVVSSESEPYGVALVYRSDV